MVVATAADKATPPVVPLATFFTNPDRARPAVSPDGAHLAYLAPGTGDAKNLQVWVQPLADVRNGSAGTAKELTRDKSHDIRHYTWARDAGAILYMQDADGNEDFHLFMTDLDAKNVRDLTPFQGVGLDQHFINGAPWFEPRSRPGTLLVALNLEDRRHFAVYRVDLRTGALELHFSPPPGVVGVLVDHDAEVRTCLAFTSDGGESLLVKDTGTGEWVEALLGSPLDEIRPITTVDDNGKNMVLVAHSVGMPAIRLAMLDLNTRKFSAAVEGDQASTEDMDVAHVAVHEATRQLQAYATDNGRTMWHVVDPAERVHYDVISARARELDADYTFGERTPDDQVWVVKMVCADKPAEYYLYHKHTHALEFLFTSMKALAQYPLGKMRSVRHTARDGLELQAYVTTPVEYDAAAPRKWPLVLLVHGGPWARDMFGCQPLTHWLANRGYVVMQPNYRGSTGFNKQYLTASFKQWGKAMHTDLLDAVEHAVDHFGVDRARVCVMGGSYGGYAALAAVTLTPDAVTCAVDIVGPSNIKTLLATIPPYWEPMAAKFHARVGHPEHDSADLDACSPLTHAHRIVRPLMIAQGANDPRVKVSESTQIVDAIARNGGRVTYVEYTDEGHGFARPVNRLDFFGKCEAFLYAHMGAEGLRIEDGCTVTHTLKGSSATVRVVGDQPTA